MDLDLTTFKKLSNLALLHHRQFNAARKVHRMEYLLRGNLVVIGLCFKNIGHILLRVTVNDREPRALYLHHYFMAFFKHMIGAMQVNGICFHFFGRYRFRV